MNTKKKGINTTSTGSKYSVPFVPADKFAQVSQNFSFDQDEERSDFERMPVECY